MGLGILESRSMRDVPGTARLEDLDNHGHITIAADTSRLKVTKDGIILVPQPTDDPNDPLNWPLWRRDMITFLLCLLSILATTLSPLLAANTLTLLFWFENQSITNMALLTGYHLLGVALAGFLFVATARVWGKRHSYIIGTVIIIASSVWGGYAGKNYGSLVAARFFQGVGLAPFEACVNASVADMYCVHERGKRMAFSNLCLFGGAFFTPVIVGIVTHNMGWWWPFWFVAIFTGIVLPFVFVYCPETTFVRDDKLSRSTDNLDNELDNISSPSSSEGRIEVTSFSDSIRKLGSRDSEIKRLEDVTQISIGSHGEDKEGQQTAVPAPWVSKTALKLFNGRFTHESFFKLLLRPLPLFFHPGVLWACLIQGTLIGWTALIGVILALVMAGPPLGFDEVRVGYLYTGAFIGAVCGFILSGLLSDWSVSWLCKKNKGIFEPEFRMMLVIPQAILGCVGLYGFGATSADTMKYGWFWPDFFFGCVTCGMVLGAVSSALYLSDGFQEIELEGFTCLLIFKNMFTFGLTFKAFDWLLQLGVGPMMLWAASLQVGILALTIPMYVLGKRNRAFWTHYDMLRILRLR